MDFESPYFFQIQMDLVHTPPLPPFFFPDLKKKKIQIPNLFHILKTLYRPWKHRVVNLSALLPTVPSFLAWSAAHWLQTVGRYSTGGREVFSAASSRSRGTNYAENCLTWWRDEYVASNLGHRRCLLYCALVVAGVPREISLGLVIKSDGLLESGAREEEGDRRESSPR